MDSSHLRPLLESYIRSKRYNIIQLSHYYYTTDKSPGVYGEVMFWLGELFGSVISKLIKIGLPLQSIELIGHSYGGCVAFLTAKNTFPKLPLLVGLDPSPWVHFQKGYADYTIALHTNMGAWGTRFYKESDSDLVANGGTLQPKCPSGYVFEIDSEDEIVKLNQCCHKAALDYWGSMIENPGLFYGVKCDETDCNYHNVQLLGPNLRTPGIFHFKTSKYSPFGLGMEGIKNITPIDIHLLNAYHDYMLQFKYVQNAYIKYFSDTYEYYVNGGFKSKTVNNAFFLSNAQLQMIQHGD
ncbi:uncharacterized protein LOC123305607 [Chrysoperla carnea]|uniref:uncharacterized protein LOC123305607 n=1 Tax=Chrysoperla carnea TaxID=189513 RepID=UPI001D076BB2|nr:uncharacterized protein LOC123305607 [Chrysoperla carnea]